jgi:hypothetical protein
MAPMKGEVRRALKNAVEKRRKDETFERSLGRAMRNSGLDYSDYIEVMSEVRRIAKRRKIGLDEAALRLSEQKEEQE